MKLETKTDLTLFKDIMFELLQEGMIDAHSYQAVSYCYREIKQKRGVFQPYADNWRLSPEYYSGINTNERLSDIREVVAEWKNFPVAKALEKMVKLHKNEKIYTLLEEEE